MITPSAARSLAATFHDSSDGQALKSRELVLLLLESVPDPFSRAQFNPGHITCTGLVFASDSDRVLLVHHRRLDRWLLPGGHVEPSDAAIWDAASREVVEETGVELIPSPTPVLAGMDVHGIPSNGHEPYHLRHDLLFAFRAAGDAIRCSPESCAVAWCMPAEFDRYQLPDNVRRAYARVRPFYN